MTFTIIQLLQILIWSLILKSLQIQVKMTLLYRLTSLTPAFCKSQDPLSTPFLHPTTISFHLRSNVTKFLSPNSYPLAFLTPWKPPLFTPPPSPPQTKWSQLCDGHDQRTPTIWYRRGVTIRGNGASVIIPE